ncbi:unnamed protein product [Pseudo-nitzschia multistriata]|uniref:Protein kinase domain-containing protein n=1 Tax=Pseudo-nitzschia multistriata TaxID=183589 RepID=A0A448ZQE0_9STRA|nr:unnamed protein product [Pseudo-nitzschia multistriata]
METTSITSDGVDGVGSTTTLPLHLSATSGGPSESSNGQHRGSLSKRANAAATTATPASSNGYRGVASPRTSRTTNSSGGFDAKSKSRHHKTSQLPGTRRQLYRGIVVLVAVSCCITVYSTLAVVGNEAHGTTSSDEHPMSPDLYLATGRRVSDRPRTMVWRPELKRGDSHGSPLVRVPSTLPLHLPQPFVADTADEKAREVFFELPGISNATTEDNHIDDGSASAKDMTAARNSTSEEGPQSSSATTRDGKKCLPMADWMEASFPNCNSVHEIDMRTSVSTANGEDETEADLKFLGQGWFRATWKYRNYDYDYEEESDEEPEGSDESRWKPPPPPSAVVLKTLRIEREFLDEYFDLHRRDAVAMERLTFSPYVVNVHGYCGQSAINELAEGILGGKITNLEQLDRRLRGKEEDPQALFLKLQLATGVALGLAHVHNVHVSDASGGRSGSVQTLLYEHTDPDSAHSTTGFGRSVPTMAHYDLNPRNIAIMRDGSPKLNDFNIAEFLTYDPDTNQPCGFRSRLHEPWWRAPEEMNTNHTSFVDEKVDIYALGEVLFHILTTHGPRGKMKKYRMEEVREVVRKGIRPDMWEPFASGGRDGKLAQNGVVRAFFRAMDLCFEPDPAKRGTAIQVARVLHRALAREKEAKRKQQAQGEERR